MIWGFDTETDNDGNSAWIVQWVITGKAGTYKGTDTRALLHRLRTLGRSREHQYIYIHNLKYDLEFLRIVLWNLQEEYGAKLTPIFRNGQPIQVSVEVNNRILIFRDSAKKWQGNLRSLGGALDYPKLENIDPDFKPGWSAALDLDSEEDWKYVIRDARICAKAGEFWHGGGFKHATTSGDAWADMRNMIGIPLWKELFPPLTRELDDILRDGYFGGINISRNKGHHKGPITHEDKVSMFPGVMLLKPLPVGNPIYMGAVKPQSGLWVGKMRVKLHIKEGHIPWFTFKNGIDYCGEDIEYGQHIEDCKQWHNLTLTCVDWENLSIDYDIEVDTCAGEFWAFKQRTGVLTEYIEKWGAEKKKAKKGSAEREHAKRMLNAAYGRFALIPDESHTELVMDEETSEPIWRTHEEKGEPSAYLPYAMFVTAWARRELMDRVRKVVDAYGVDSVLHCDTDSVIYLGEPLGGYGKDLGMWDLESRPNEIYEGGFKRYIEVFRNAEKPLDRFKVTCAGVPQPKRADDLPYGMWVELLDKPTRIFGEELGDAHYTIKSKWLREMYKDAGKDPDDVNTLKLLPRRVPGGVILEGHTHKIDDDGLKIRLSRSV